jgi:hypothetical protein
VNVSPNSKNKNKQDKRPFKRGTRAARPKKFFTKSNKLTHNTQDCFFKDPNKKVEFLRRQLKPEAANHLENPSNNDNDSDSDDDEDKAIDYIMDGFFRETLSQTYLDNIKKITLCECPEEGEERHSCR